MSTATAVIYDKKEQLQKIEAGLLPGETVSAVYDMKGGGTGFVGITSKRLIVYDKSFMSKMKAIVSIPYRQIHSVAAEDSTGLLTGRGWLSSSTLVVTTGQGALTFEFHGADKAHQAHNLILGHLL